MPKLVTVIAAVILLSSIAYAQKYEKPKVSVVWSAEANCHLGNSREVKALEPRCSVVTVDSTTFYIINYAGISYAMAHRPVRDYIVTSVQISNRSEDVLHITPLRSRMVRFGSFIDFLGGSKGVVSTAESQDELRQATYRESTVLGETDGQIRTGLRVQERHEDTKVRGKIVARTTAYDPAAPQTEDATPSAITSSLLIPREVFVNVMKSRVLAAGQKTAGHMVFKNADEKNEGYIVFYLNAGPIEFVFPAPLQQQK